MDQMEELKDVVTKELIEFFTGPKAVRDSDRGVNTAKLAVASLSAVGRYKATERAKQGMQLAVVKMIAKDEKEAKQYISATMPELTPPKLLGRPKK